MAFIITTTGVPATVVIDDLGERTFVHPVVSYNLESEYSSFELAESVDLQAAITGGELTAVDGSGNPITLIDQLTDLQSAYNSSTNPEIVTDATLGAVTIKRGSASDADDIIVGQRGSGAVVYAVTGAGNVTGSNFNGVSLTTGGAATDYLDATGAYSTPTGGTNIGTNNLTLTGNRTLDLDDKSLGLLNAAQGMAIGAATADASAILDLTSTGEGFLPPRMTTAQMNAMGSPADGLMIFDITTYQWMGYNGTSWVILG
jgi:hypothetical protein